MTDLLWSGSDPRAGGSPLRSRSTAPRGETPTRRAINLGPSAQQPRADPQRQSLNVAFGMSDTMR